MVEILTVLLVLGVLAATARGLFSNADYAREAAEAEQLRMDLRYAQQRAIGSLEDVVVKINKNQDAYWFADDDHVFVNGANRIELESDLKSSPNITFEAQTGLPTKDTTYSYRIGESCEVTVNGETGLVQ